MELTEREWKEFMGQLKQANKTLNSINENINQESRAEYWLKTLPNCSNCGMPPKLIMGVDKNHKIIYKFQCSCRETASLDNLETVANVWHRGKHLSWHSQTLDEPKRETISE